MSETNGNRRRLSVDVIDDPGQDEGTSFYDPADPVFAPPKQNITKNKKSWKRKLLGWGFVLILVGGGVLALFLLLRVNPVNVRVQADPRRESPNSKAESSPNSPENGLSAEAINIAREAIGNDAGTAPTTNPTAEPNASPVASPSSSTIPRMLSFTDNSPAYAQPNEASSPVKSNQANASGTQPQAIVTDPSSPGLQSRANPTQSLFVDDSPAKASSQTTNLSHPQKKAISTDASKAKAPAVLPLFGTMLPVRTQAVIFSLRNNSYARLELARDCQGEGWSLTKGTLLIGRVSGSEHDRAFINILGYIDPKTNRLVKMSGEVMGSDGGSGIQGKRVAVDRNRLKQTLSKVASSGLQVASMMAGALTGRGTVVLNGAGYRVLNPITDEAGRIVNGGDSKRSFVKVEAGQPAYVMVADLPNELHAVDAPGGDEFALATTSLTDREVMELILFGSPDDIRTALPLMNDEQKRLVVKSIPKEK
ncbi:MAG: conjugative transposon protein TraM [Pyrinomonadaceae bacterium]